MVFSAQLKYIKTELIKAFPVFASFGLNDKLVISADSYNTIGSFCFSFFDSYLVFRGLDSQSAGF